MLALECENVKKTFAKFEALKGVSLSVKAGECFGLLGPNGAGKSTLISMIYGSQSRTSGRIQVFGLDPQTQGRKVRARIGVVTQDNNLDNSMTVQENMEMYSRYVGMDSGARADRIAELLEFMQLSHKSEAVIESLSGGMQRRLVFVRALLAKPQLVILDEPTTGLDPAVRQLLWDKVVELKKNGATILLTTHYMDEAERLCDRLVIMDQGQIKAEGSPRDLIAKNCPAYFAGVDKLVMSGDSLQSLTDELVRKNIQPQFIRPSNLEDVFLKITGRELADND